MTIRRFWPATPTAISNERLVAQEGSLRTYYACEGKAEYVESGGSTTPQWSKTYIYLGARLLSTLTPNGSGGEFIQYHHPDRLGTRLVTNAQDTNSFEFVFQKAVQCNRQSIPQCKESFEVGCGCPCGCPRGSCYCRLTRSGFRLVAKDGCLFC